jgi:proteasome assembly chaperone (PAC2) family protein
MPTMYQRWINVLLLTGQASSTTKTGRHDIAEKLLKVALKTQ